MTEREATRWELSRKLGKAGFIPKKAGVFALQFFLVWNLLLGLLKGNFDHLTVSTLLVSLVGSIVSGLFIAIVTWWENDARYQNTILDRKIRKGFGLGAE